MEQSISEQVKTKINNTSNAPKKKSDYKAYQLGFKDCFNQVLKIIEQNKKD